MNEITLSVNNNLTNFLGDTLAVSNEESETQSIQLVQLRNERKLAEENALRL